MAEDVAMNHHLAGVIRGPKADPELATSISATASTSTSASTSTAATSTARVRIIDDRPQFGVLRLEAIVRTLTSYPLQYNRSARVRS